ncbi:hypothetical protein RUND412_000941 [Rhizina undulata]
MSTCTSTSPDKPTSRLKDVDSGYKSHLERTAGHYRSPTYHPATLTSLTSPTPHHRLLTFAAPSLDFFLPGQFVDLRIPGVDSVGGFTIVTPPCALPEFRLLVQEAPTNPAAAWAWRSEGEIVGSRVEIKRHAHSPLISILTHIATTPSFKNLCVDLLYSSRPPILFLPEILDIVRRRNGTTSLRLFLTGASKDTAQLPGFGESKITVVKRRMTGEDLEGTIVDDGEAGRRLVYVCGPRGFTAEMVGAVERTERVSGEDLMTEIWW